MKTEPVNIADKLALFNETWTPRIVGALNGQLAKLDGELMWHAHEDEDELFLVIKGRLTNPQPRQVLYCAARVQHNPIAVPGTSVLLFEPDTTKHTGEKITERTVTDQAWI